MNIQRITVKNFRGLCDVDTALSSFTCVIGENNAGKSSLLLALKLFIEGKKISAAEFYDSNQDVTITVELYPITRDDLDVLAEEHRERIERLIVEKKLTLIRRFSIETPPKLNCMKRVPVETRFNSYDDVLRGKRGKEIHEVLKTNFPEISDENYSQITTQGAAKAEIEKLIEKLPDDCFKMSEEPLPTGFENSIKAMLPEPIYIPAVKELGEDIKTKESTPFGKLLGILLNVIGDQLAEAQETFENLNRKLNDLDGVENPERLRHVREIEQTIQGYVRDTFIDTRLQLRIPPPDIKTVLSNAEIWADDGVMTRVEAKGDGFKRAVTFSILRSYVELSKRSDWQSSSTNADKHGSTNEQKYLFLFEEPELYLHPKSQRILFEALAEISNKHQVIISTHSPFFFSPDATSAFIKIIKRPRTMTRPKPYGHLLHVNTKDMRERDRFQMISFEIGNTAFFAEKIVLVEGDSDLITYPHMANLLNPAWKFGKGKVDLVKIGGKGSIKRYREFFARFDIQVFVIGDLDILLDGQTDYGFSVNNELKSDLGQLLETLAAENHDPNEDSWNQFKKVKGRGDQKGLWYKIDQAYHSYKADHTQVEQLHQAIDAFFAFQDPYLKILKESYNQELIDLKRQLLAELRSQKVFVLEKGAVEAYYPDVVPNRDNKVERAQEYCRQVKTHDQVIEKCEKFGDKYELELIFESIFTSS